MTNQLHWADNSIMKSFAADSIDLIYMDPPYNSRLTHRVRAPAPPKDKVVAFHDIWQWDHVADAQWTELTQQEGPQALHPTLSYLRTVLGPSPTLAYLATLTQQLLWVHRLLRHSGAVYLHCPSQYSHYLRLVMEGLFGQANFRNQIIWSYRTGGVSKRHFARKHDVILFFSKSRDHVFRPQYYRSYQKKRYGYNPRYPEHYDPETNAYYHWAVCRDVWEDIPAIGTCNRERTGFPTQKPEALLERIIEASSQPGQRILDPFSGSGTTLVVAHRLGRCWQGIDSSKTSISFTRRRLAEAGISDYHLLRPEGKDPCQVETNTGDHQTKGDRK